MTSRLDRNRALHTKLFTRQPFERHAIVVQSPVAPLCETGDYATSVLGGPEGPTMVPGWVSPDDVATLLRQAPPGTRFIFNSAAMETAEQGSNWLRAAQAASLIQRSHDVR